MLKVNEINRKAVVARLSDHHCTIKENLHKAPENTFKRHKTNTYFNSI